MAPKGKPPKNSRKFCPRCRVFVRVTTTPPRGRCALCNADLRGYKAVPYGEDGGE